MLQFLSLVFPAEQQLTTYFQNDQEFVFEADLTGRNNVFVGNRFVKGPLNRPAPAAGPAYLGL